MSVWILQVNEKRVGDTDETAIFGTRKEAKAYAQEMYPDYTFKSWAWFVSTISTDYEATKGTYTIQKVDMWSNME